MAYKTELMERLEIDRLRLLQDLWSAERTYWPRVHSAFEVFLKALLFEVKERHPTISGVFVTTFDGVSSKCKFKSPITYNLLIANPQSWVSWDIGRSAMTFYLVMPENAFVLVEMNSGSVSFRYATLHPRSQERMRYRMRKLNSSKYIASSWPIESCDFQGTFMELYRLIIALCMIPARTMAMKLGKSVEDEDDLFDMDVEITAALSCY